MLASGQRFVLANAQRISFSAVLDVTPVRMKYPAEAEAVFGIEGPHDNKKGFAKALRGVGDTLVEDPYGPTGRRSSPRRGSAWRTLQCDTSYRPRGTGTPRSGEHR
ncbi:hypothetical protein [Streptomyces katrae]|uniref:hypothetical protein n=1 Tax=Streptomyces katrae TaxID=68223 RepID=UPI00131D39E1|nr:hypothetical protein [Streptomyces katrae]